MKLLTGIRIALGAILVALLAAGCVPLQRATAPAASPSPSPAALQYDADPLDWLAQKAGEGAAHETLSKTEMEQLVLLANGIAYVPVFFHAGDLCKEDILQALYIYYQDSSYFNDATGQAEVRQGLFYPPDGAQTIRDFCTRAYLSARKADSFIHNILGTSIPDNTFDYVNPDNDEVVCKDGIYYIYPGDPEYYELHLRAYQPLGDGIFYLSFDGDDSGMSGPEEDKKGNIPDLYRLLVVRSSSAWGFTVKAKLKKGDDSLLPVDFPFPLYAA